MNKTEILSQYNLLIGCERSMLYHEARARFYSRWQLLIQFLVLVFSTTGVPLLLEEIAAETTTPWLVSVTASLMIAIGVLTVFNLVYNPSAKSSHHESLARDFTRLEGGITAAVDADRAALSGWTRELYALYAKEPPVYCALSVLCANHILLARGADPDYFVDLGWHHLLLRNLHPFSSVDFRNRRQIRQDHASRKSAGQKSAAQPA